MAIAEMLRVAVVGLTDDADIISEILQKHGCVQIEAITEEGHTKRLSDETNLQDRAMKAEELAIDLKAALDFMDRQKQVKKGMLSTFIGWHYRIDEDEYLKHVAGGETRAREISELAKQSEGLLNNIANEIKAIDSKVEALRPWTSIEIPTADFTRLKHHSFYFLSADSVKGLKSLDEALKGLEEPAAYQELSRDDRKVYGIIAINKADAQKCLQLLAHEGYDAAEMMDSTLPPAIEIKKLEGRRAELLKAQEPAKQGALKLCDLRPEAFSLYDHYANEKARYETAGGFLATESSFALEGWVRKDLLEGLKQELSRRAASTVVISRKPEDGEDVPVDLINNGIFSPFEAVTRIMGLPRQGSIDPTPLLAVFFFIYFGTSMGDAVYGIIMAALGLLLLKKIKTAGMGTQLLQLLVVGGIATILMGVLFGGYFGDLFSRYLKPLWFDPMSPNGPLLFLGFSFGMGIVQILFGMAIKAWDNARNGKWLSAIYDQGFWAVLLLGVGLLVGGNALGPGYSEAGKWMSIIGAIQNQAVLRLVERQRTRTACWLRCSTGIPAASDGPSCPLARPSRLGR